MKTKPNNKVQFRVFTGCPTCRVVEDFVGNTFKVKRLISKFYAEHVNCKYKPTEYFCTNNCGTVVGLEGEICYKCWSKECDREPQHEGPCKGLPSATCKVFQSPVIDEKRELLTTKPRCACYDSCVVEADGEFGMCIGCNALGCNSPAKDEARFRKLFADKPSEEEEKPIPPTPDQSTDPSGSIRPPNPGTTWPTRSKGWIESIREWWDK